MELNKAKPFEQPDAGMFLGTIIDVVDMPQVQTNYGVKNKVRILWILTKTDNTPTLDSEGKPHTVAFIKPASMHEKSDLYKLVTMILNTAPPILKNTEELAQLLLGRANVLFITKTPNDKRQGEFYANVTGVAPLQSGQLAPKAPQGFQRAKDKPATQGGFVQRAAPASLQASPVQTAPTQPTPDSLPLTNNVSFEKNTKF